MFPFRSRMGMGCHWNQAEYWSRVRNAEKEGGGRDGTEREGGGGVKQHATMRYQDINIIILYVPPSLVCAETVLENSLAT